MEEPQFIDEPAIAEPKARAIKRLGKPAGGKKAKMSGAALSFVIALIVFALGLVLCVIEDGALNAQITGSFKDNTDLDQLGGFFVPFLVFTIDFTGWATTALGTLFGELAIIIGAVLVIISFAAGQGEIGKATKENRKPVMPSSAKLYKYGWLPVLPFLIGAGIWLLLWLLGMSDLFSIHMVIATSTTSLALAYIGSRMKALAIVFAFASVFYVVMMGIARMAAGASDFLAVLLSSFVTFALVMFTYFSVLDVPGQEMIFRHQRTYSPFNDGYRLLLEGRAAIKENKAEGVKSVSAGLEKLAVAKANAEDINKYQHNLGAFIARVDDITSRVGILLQQQPIDPKGWSYLC
ncbi:MAG: hypothetical protein JW839_09485 [Candidatus Lokiarchaeota archaeon]|nr:hypothetical protein [Candidatus Lokiarchaeota archaeon]